jgi:hypothetical protein
MLSLHRFFLPVFCCLLAVAAFCPDAHGATAQQIATALDNPVGVTFSASSSWVYKAGNVADIIPKGVPSFNTNYMVCASPGKANPQKLNFFTVTIQGAGTLSFRYQASLDDYNWAELCAYENDYEWGWLWGASGYWDNYVDQGEDWWEEGEIPLGAENYTRTITFAVVGPTSEGYEKPELDPEWGEKLYNKAWLDKFVWTPDEDARLLAFNPDPEELNSFNEKLTVYLESDYENLTFHYTTDGSAPNANSPVYDPDAGITITRNTTISAIVYEGDARVDTTVYSASYMRKTAPPQLNITQNELQNPALLEFSSDTPGAVFYYTLNNNVPERLENGQPGENTFTGSQVTLTKTSTVQVLAWADGLANSDVVSETFEKLPTPEISFAVNGTPSVHPFFDKNDQGTLTLTTMQGARIRYQITGDAIQLYENPLNINQTTEIRFQAQQEGKLHSNTVTRKFYRTNTLFPLDPLEAPGWSLFFLPGEVSEKTSKELIKQWHPIAHDSQKKTYYRPDLLRGGGSYWIFTPEGGTRAEAIEHIYIYPLPGITIPAKTWILSGVPEDASIPQDIQAQTWDGETFQPVSPPPTDTAAWLYSPVEIK